MAEQFILPNATTKVVRNFVKTVKCTITPLAHANIGWNANSRALYNGMMGINGAAPIINRNGLPPHFYIEIPSNTLVPNNGDTDLVRVLSRGRIQAVFKALDAASQGDWDQGRYFDALNKELKKGNVSISIYHFDGTEVSQADRDKVDGFS